MFQEFGLQGKCLAIVPGDFSGEIQELLMGFGGGFSDFLGSLDQYPKTGYRCRIYGCPFLLGVHLDDSDRLDLEAGSFGYALVIGFRPLSSVFRHLFSVFCLLSSVF